MRLIMMIIVIGLAGNAGAAMYKCKDDQGNLIYTDLPCAGGEEVKLPPTTTYKSKPLPKSGTSSSEETTSDKDFKYTKLSIVRPEPNQTIRTREGTVNVEVITKPKLRKGHKVAIILDGKQQTASGAITFKLTKLTRGMHTLQAKVLDEAGKELIQSRGVTFFVRIDARFTEQETEEGEIVSPQKAPAAPQAPMAPRLNRPIPK